MSGEATIEVGKERLEFPAGPFAYFGENALLCGRNNADQIINEDPSSKNHQISTFNEDSSTSVSSQFMNPQIPIYSKLYVPDFSLRVDDR